ncbi:E3 ubiquitin-protein ligase parkin isoform X1 [Euwallacea fornicatus]|uniref:E3 ubiquitin-protein ligase parkin isoform X1 n=1 Tax=Euwallacea fornicatus TaxID=995702 RepID=UPI00338F10B9
MLKFLTSFFTSIIQTMLQLLTSKKHIIQNLLSIYVKTTTGSKLSLDIDPKCKVAHIKGIVAPQMGLQPDELKVIFAGKELGDDVIIEECDLGQQSILHVVKIKPQNKGESHSTTNNSKLVPLSESLDDSMFFESSMDTIPVTEKKVHFYVYCPTCKDLKQGKLRVRCHFCKSGAFTVHSEPQNWGHVLTPKQITGTCENDPQLCENILQNQEPTFAEFYFKCSEHVSLGEGDQAVPLDLIRPNLRQLQCLACLEIPETMFTFPCQNNHIVCVDCFRQYCMSKLTERQFWQHPEFGYTLICPNGCPDSFIKEVHHFRLLDVENYERYHRFAAEEFVLQSGGMLCPQPGCGTGILADPECTRISCHHCKYIFCRNCLQGYHIGECDPSDTTPYNDSGCCNDELSCIPNNEAEDASRTTIKVITKPCPSCKTPTERDGGCMHMVCTRAGCKYHWCWVCQTEWSRECMADHWFG